MANQQQKSEHRALLERQGSEDDSTQAGDTRNNQARGRASELDRRGGSSRSGRADADSTKGGSAWHVGGSRASRNIRGSTGSQTSAGCCASDGSGGELHLRNSNDGIDGALHAGRRDVLTGRGTSREGSRDGHDGRDGDGGHRHGRCAGAGRSKSNRRRNGRDDACVAMRRADTGHVPDGGLDFFRRGAVAGDAVDDVLGEARLRAEAGGVGVVLAAGAEHPGVEALGKDVGAVRGSGNRSSRGDDHG